MTDLIHGQVSVNNGDVKFGARKDTREVETSSTTKGSTKGGSDLKVAMENYQ